MTCYTPLKAHRLDDGTISFKARTGEGDAIDLACGQCIGCRIGRSKMWAVRCMHEASLYENNCFLTLTYSDEHLPIDSSLDYSHYQGFMKRLRKRYQGIKIRFYMCGEYGDLNYRPHYHAIIFNHDFHDKELFFSSKSGHKVYRSQQLEELWKFGQSSIGNVTEQSAGYVARYVVKKIIGRGHDINPKTGKRFDAVYDRVNPETGEIYKVIPEFTRMSLKPGIAQGWFDKFYNDVYPLDAIVTEGGRRMKPPRYYDKKYDAIEPYEFEAIKQERIMQALKNSKESTPERLAVKEEVLTAKTQRLIRSL